MPIPAEEKIRFLRQNNLDPARFDIDDNTGDVYERFGGTGEDALTQPSATADTSSILLTRQDQKSNTMGAGKAAGIAAAANVFPSVVGQLGGLATGKVLGGLGPWGNIAGNIVGGALATYGAGKLQEPFLPESFKQQTAQAYEEHPYASFAGSLAPFLATSNLGGSLTQGIQGAKALTRALTKAPKEIGLKALTPAEKTAAGQLALNVGVGGALPVAMAPITGQEINARDIALNALAGGLFTKPRGWVERTFYPKAPVEPPPIPETTGTQLTPGPLPPRPEVIVPPALSDLERTIPVKRSVLTKQLKKEGKPLYEAPRTAEESARRIAEIYRPIDEPAQREVLLTKKVQADEQLNALKRASVEAKNQAIENEAVAKLKQAEHENVVAYNEARASAMQAETERLKSLASENTLRITQESMQREMSSGGLAKVRPGTIRLQEKAKLGSAKEPTPAELERAYEKTQKFGAKRVEETGATLKEGADIPQAGAYDPATGQILTGKPGVRGGETILHEVGHHLHQKLQAGDAADQKLLERGKRSFGSEEPFVDAAGLMAGKQTLAEIDAQINRDYFGLKKTQVKNWIHDVLSNLKYKMGLGSEEDVARLLAGRIREQKDFSYLERKALDNLKVGGPKFSEQGKLGSEILDTPSEDLIKQAGSITRYMWNVGAKAKTPEDVVQLKAVAEESSKRVADAKAKGDLFEAMKIAGKQPSEAYEYATGVKLDGTPKWTTLEKMIPGYKPPVPDEQYLKAKGITTDALQKQSTDEVPLQPETAVSEEMAGGTPKTELEGIAGEKEEKLPHREVSEGDEVKYSEKAKLGSPVEQTESPEFKKWFGDSKVVDAEGKPLVVYHGTKGKDFTSFKEGDIHFFTENPYFASYYAENAWNRVKGYTKTGKAILNNGDRVYPAFLSLKNPKEIFSSEIDASKHKESELNQAKLAKEQGYDGLIIKDKDGLANPQYVAFYPEQIKSAIGNRGTFDPTNPDIRYQERAKLGSPLTADEPPIRTLALTPEVETVRKIGTKEAKLAAKGGEDFFSQKRFRSGSFREQLVQPFEEANLPDSAKNLIGKWLWENQDTRGKPSFDLPSNLARLVKNYHTSVKGVADTLNKAGIKIQRGEDFTEIFKAKWGYYPMNLAEDAVRTLMQEKPDPTVVAKIAKLWQDHAIKKGATPAEAKQEWDAYEAGLAFRARDITADIDYGPLRKAMGRGLPYELVEKDPLRNLERYANRAGAALAFHETISNVPEIAHVLSMKGPTDQYWAKTNPELVKDLGQVAKLPATQEMMRSIFGVTDQHQLPNVMASARLLSAGLLGTGTAVRNIAAIPTQIAPFKGVVESTPKAVHELWNNWTELNKRARSAGSVRKSYKSFDVPVNEDYDVALNRWQNFAAKAHQALRTLSGRNLSDQIEGLFYHALGENLTTAKIQTKSDPEFLRKFGHTVEDLDAKIADPAKFTPEDVQKIAGNFVDTVRGSYDPRQLPTMAMRGQLAPFFALNRWNIGKANTMWRDIVNPAIKDGNLKPFIKTAFTALGTGYLIEQINELMSGKRGVDPTTKEVLETGDAEDKAAKLVDLLQLGSFMGIITDFAKIGIRTYQGKDIKYASPVSFPLYTWTTDTVMRGIGDASKAVQNGEDKIDVLGKLMVDIAADSLQTLRYVRNWYNQDETKRKEMFRDYRVWQEMTGQISPESAAIQSNEYENLAAKKFKRTSDVGEAVQMLPELIQQAVEKSKNRDGTISIDLLRKSFRSLKQNNYQIMPSPEEFPTSFMQYVQHLQKTQGDEAATNRIVKFLSQRQLNKAKGSLVPSF